MYRIFNILGDKFRWRIFQAFQEGEKTINDVAREFGTRDATVAIRLGPLIQVGLILERKEGRRGFYSAAYPDLYEAFEELLAKLDACGLVRG